MTPILYENTETEFASDGIGTLTDAISCVVTEERNGAFELEMAYPMDGMHFDKIARGQYIKAKPNSHSDPQIFRIYRITRPMNGNITAYAEHISYELAGNMVLGFSAKGTVLSMLENLFSDAVFPTPFTPHTDMNTTGEVSIGEPCSIRACLGGKEGSFLDTFGGEYEFDNFDVTLWQHRGEDRGASIEYGKNLTDVSQEENIESTYTSIIPYVKRNVNGEDVYTYLPEKYLDAPNAGIFPRKKALLVDFSSNFDQQEEVDTQKLAELGEAYIENNAIGIPKVSLNVSFIDLRKTEEYRNIAPLEEVRLCDTVTVKFPALQVNQKAKVIATVYDVLMERYDSISIGETRSNFVNAYAGFTQDTAAAENKIPGQIANATQLLTGNRGGHVVIKTDTNGKPTEILIMDTDNVETAKNVWRWNLGGLGFSDSGYEGPYDKIALTMDGAINADLITVGNMAANIIRGGVLTSLEGGLSMDLNSGSFTLKNEANENSMSLSNMGIRILHGEKPRAWLSSMGILTLYGSEEGDPMTGITYIGGEFPQLGIQESMTFKNKLCSWEYDSTRQKYILVGEDIG